MVINAARIGGVGGLRSFAEALAGCFEGMPGVVAVLPEGVPLNASIAKKRIWSTLASSGRISLFRPIVWWIYGAFFFPARSCDRILCSTHHVLPLHRRQVVTVHDIRPYYYPDSWVQSLNFRFLLPRALKRCDGILTVSETSKRILTSVYGLEEHRIHVVPNVVDTDFFHPAPRQSASCEPYLLTVGSSWKHKNVAELLRVHSYWDSKYKLKIVAAAGQYLDFLKDLAKASMIQDRVEFLTDIPVVKLRDLYQNCSALVYPSLMEGFGLPPLEAMSCGRPVVISDMPLFRELYSEIPIYVRLGDNYSWREAFAVLEGISEERTQSGVVHARSYSRARMRSAVFHALESIWGKDFSKEVFES